MADFDFFNLSICGVCNSGKLSYAFGFGRGKIESADVGDICEVELVGLTGELLGLVVALVLDCPAGAICAVVYRRLVLVLSPF